MSKSIKVIVTLLLFTFILSSCKTYIPPKQYDIQKSRTFEKTYDKVWESIVKYMGENNINYTSADKDLGIIKSTYRNSHIAGVDGFIMDCGENANEVSYTADYNIIVSKDDNQKVKVTVNTFYSCKRQYYDAYSEGVALQTSPCNSTGVFEKHILDFIGNN